jgi:hypothetical protein
VAEELAGSARGPRLRTRCLLAGAALTLACAAGLRAPVAAPRSSWRAIPLEPGRIEYYQILSGLAVSPDERWAFASLGNLGEGYDGRLLDLERAAEAARFRLPFTSEVSGVAWGRDWLVLAGSTEHHGGGMSVLFYAASEVSRCARGGGEPQARTVSVDALDGSKPVPAAGATIALSPDEHWVVVTTVPLDDGTRKESQAAITFLSATAPAASTPLALPGERSCGWVAFTSASEAETLCRGSEGRLQWHSFRWEAGAWSHAGARAFEAAESKGTLVDLARDEADGLWLAWRQEAVQGLLQRLSPTDGAATSPELGFPPDRLRPRGKGGAVVVAADGGVHEARRAGAALQTTMIAPSPVQRAPGEEEEDLATAALSGSGHTILIGRHGAGRDDAGAPPATLWVLRTPR